MPYGQKPVLNAAFLLALKPYGLSEECRLSQAMSGMSISTGYPEVRFPSPSGD